MTTTTTAEALITFPNGLVGQPDWKQFVLITPDEDAPVQVLQSVDDADLALMVTNPAQVVANYNVSLSADDYATLDLSAGERPTLLTTISIHDNLITTNLAGPLVINYRTRQGKQVVLVDPAYSTRHPVAPLAQES